MYSPQESGLYYLQSRYYDPNTGRFINADAIVSTDQGLLGNNMFAYCLNDPVSRIDVSGTESVRYTDGNTEDDNPLNDMGYFQPGNGGDGKPSSTSSPSKVRTADQQSLADLAKEVEQNAHRGKFISYEEAQLLDQWANEYGIYQSHHYAQIGSGAHWVTGWDHTHIYNQHVPFKVY